MNYLQDAWIAPAAIGSSAVLLICWFVCFFRAMAPKAGTTEWISRAVPCRFPSLHLQPFRWGGWVSLIISAAVAAAWSLFRSGSPSDIAWNLPAVAAIQAAVAALVLLLLYGSPLSAAFGAVMLIIAGMPSPVVVLCLLLLYLAVAVRPFWLQLILYLAAAACLLLLEGSDLSVILLLAAWILLYVPLNLFRSGRSAWGSAGTGILWVILTAALLAGCAWLQNPGASILFEVWSGLQGTAVWPAEWNGSALMTVLAMIPLLIYAVLLRNTAWLFGALAALLSLPQLIFGAPELTCAGGILALCGTFAAAEKRGVRWTGLIIFVLLTICIFIS